MTIADSRRQGSNNPLNVIVTGGTRGIGLGLAREFLRRGHRVAVSGRSEASLAGARSQLSELASNRSLLGHTCDVRQFDAVLGLWQATSEAFGSVDLWVNNAGRNSAARNFDELDPDDYEATVATNLLGVMHGSRVAVSGMRAQGHGRLFNMEGLGSDGRIVPRYAPYGASKCAVRYFSRALARECQGSGVMVGLLSPGMVATELLVPEAAERDPNWERQRWFFNALADKPETVCPFLVNGMLATHRNGSELRWLTNVKVLRRLLAAPFSRRDVLGSLERK